MVERHGAWIATIPLLEMRVQFYYVNCPGSPKQRLELYERMEP